MEEPSRSARRAHCLASRGDGGSAQAVHGCNAARPVRPTVAVVAQPVGHQADPALDAELFQDRDRVLMRRARREASAAPISRSVSSVRRRRSTACSRAVSRGRVGACDRSSSRWKPSPPSRKRCSRSRSRSPNGRSPGPRSIPIQDRGRHRPSGPRSGDARPRSDASPPSPSRSAPRSRHPRLPAAATPAWCRCGQPAPRSRDRRRWP